MFSTGLSKKIALVIIYGEQDQGEVVMKLEDRMAVKLLALASVQLGKAVNETLCTEPDRRLVKGLLADVKEMLSDFDQQYFQE